MFNTQINVVTFSFIVIQASIVIPVLISYLSRPQELSRLRFLILTLLFISYNIVCGMLPDNSLPINYMSQTLISFTVGIACALYFLYYIYEEYNIRPVKFFTIRTIANILIIVFILLFIIPYSITSDLNFSRKLFLIIPLGIAIMAFFNVLYNLYIDYRKDIYTHYKFRILAGAVSILSIASLPFIIGIYGDHQLIEHTSFNIGYFFTAVAYAINIIYISRIENKLTYSEWAITGTRKNKNSHKYNLLTAREKEIVSLIINNKELTYDELGEKIYLHPKTISKHVSNIYKKLDLEDRSKNELIGFFKEDTNIN